MCSLQRLQNFFESYQKFFSKNLRNFGDYPSLSGPQNHSFHKHERMQNELIVNCIASYVQSLVTPVCLVSVKIHRNFLELLENARSSHAGFPGGPRGSCLQCNCSSGLGLLVQEAIALLMIILKFPLLGQLRPN